MQHSINYYVILHAILNAFIIVSFEILFLKSIKAVIALINEYFSKDL
jgi:hypothetical protein